MYSKKRQFGNLGEGVASKFLVKQGFIIIERNYLKKWGEIDIVAKKSKKLHFIEVKTVSRENLETVSHETGYRPEENVHPAKLKRMSRVIQSYLLEKNINENEEWKFDVVIVYLDLENKKARLKLLEDLVL